nr:uncharacterized protein LOC109192492 [Ipomoea batatas]
MKRIPPPIVPPPQNQAAQPRLRDIQRPSLVDTAAGGYTGDKNSDELQAIFESLASNSRQKAVRGRRAAVHEISTQSELTTQVAELTKQINLLMTRDNSNREFCAYCNTYGHNSSVCNARPMGPPGFQQQGPSGFQHQQYRPFQQPPAPQQSQLPAQEKKPQLEEMFMQYMSSQDTMMKKLDAKIDKFKYDFWSDNDTFPMISYAHLLYAKEERLWRALTKAWHDKNNFWREFKVTKVRSYGTIELERR